MHAVSIGMRIVIFNLRRQVLSRGCLDIEFNPIFYTSCHYDNIIMRARLFRNRKEHNISIIMT